jgi:SPX domain protein involved in polyphosphate accumulation
MTIQEVAEDRKQKAYSMIRVLKIHDKIVNEFLNQKIPFNDILMAYDEAEEKYTEAMDRLEELNYLIQETERASLIIKNNLFELID